MRTFSRDRLRTCGGAGLRHVLDEALHLPERTSPRVMANHEVRERGAIMHPHYAAPSCSPGATTLVVGHHQAQGPRPVVLLHVVISTFKPLRGRMDARAEREAKLAEKRSRRTCEGRHLARQLTIHRSVQLNALKLGAHVLIADSCQQDALASEVSNATIPEVASDLSTARLPRALRSLGTRGGRVDFFDWSRRTHPSGIGIHTPPMSLRQDQRVAKTELVSRGRNAGLSASFAACPKATRPHRVWINKPERINSHARDHS